MTKYIEFIKWRLNRRDVLEQLAEEAAELSQAALKLIRAEGLSGNMTPRTEEEARANIKEEICDVLALIYLLGWGYLIAGIAEYSKWERWARRLGYKKEDDKNEGK